MSKPHKRPVPASEWFVSFHVYFVQIYCCFSDILYKFERSFILCQHRTHRKYCKSGAFEATRDFPASLLGYIRAYLCKWRAWLHNGPGFCGVSVYVPPDFLECDRVKDLPKMAADLQSGNSSLVMITGIPAVTQEMDISQIPHTSQGFHKTIPISHIWCIKSN